MAETPHAPESRTLLLRRIAQLEDDLAETRGCIIRLASVIESLLIDGPQHGPGDADPETDADADAADAAEWIAPVVLLEPGRPRQNEVPAHRKGANRSLRGHATAGGLRRLRLASSGNSSGTARR
jgi:hypothetical protein